ncbi:LADA_0G06832g1_1 [Lachancea dasiensis]|uniref:LADA_0G06832g1_1 n=1 Tax=Lachancea dasiensis TaxID=1072105 RepID=A0A1G4JTR4_9SACH|nr:LADA_0G06832g1_1 [Lachancea dasiensis]
MENVLGGPKISKGSYTRQSFLSLRKLGSKKPQLGMLSSRTSSSQLKLNLLTDGKRWEILEDYGLEELRDGFFDPVFTTYEPVTDEDADDKSTTTSQKVYAHPQPWCLKQFHKFKKNWQRILKFWMAFFAAFCICLVRPAGSWVGHRHRYFLPLAVVIHHPARNVGVQLEICIWSIVGAALGMGWSSLAWYISVATRPAANYQGGIFFASLFIAIYLSSWLMASNQRLLYLALSFGIAITYLHAVSLVDDFVSLEWMFYWDFGISYLFGLLLSLLVCVTIFPHAGQSEVVGKFSASISAIKLLLVAFLSTEECSDGDKIHLLLKAIGRKVDFDVSESMREFIDQITVTRIDQRFLLEFRNTITNMAAPLRSLPIDHQLVTKLELEKFYEQCHNKFQNCNSEIVTENSTNSFPVPLSESTAPPSNVVASGLSVDQEVFASVLRSTFSDDIISLIVEMIALLETIELFFKQLKNMGGSNSPSSELKLTRQMNKLRREIFKLDQSYRDFTKSEYFSKELLSDPQAIDSFLFLRYMRQSAKYLIPVASCVKAMSSNLRWRISFPRYSLHRALKRLPKECSIDQGAKTLLQYYQAKADVDDVFEQLYHSYTSNHENTASSPNDDRTIRATIRAVDHKDFSLHTTSHWLRYRLWVWSSEITSNDSKWALKIAFLVTFLALPGWLPTSHNWYEKYQCWWAPLVFFILVNRRNTGNWASFSRRLVCSVLGIFGGWCANQARHFGNPYVIATFASIFCPILSFNFFANGNRKSSFTGILCFTVIALESYGKGESDLNTAEIWKNTWITGAALLCGILPSIPVNWIIWSFTARHELRMSVASLLAHIGQSYQSVADRYLYRDADDAPTEVTLRYSNIREVRMSQSLIAVKEMLRKARTEPNYIFVFKADVYQQLLDGCELLLEKMIQARISGQYFEVWEQDKNSSISRALLSLRRDSVAAVIFVLYMLSNCFTSKHKVPIYLPNPIMSRKKLFDFITKFESTGPSRTSTIAGKRDPNFKELSADDEDNEDDRSHWTLIHGMAFTRAFTEISEIVQKLIYLSREILGEETCF